MVSMRCLTIVSCVSMSLSVSSLTEVELASDRVPSEAALYMLEAGLAFSFSLRSRFMALFIPTKLLLK